MKVRAEDILHDLRPGRVRHRGAVDATVYEAVCTDSRAGDVAGGLFVALGGEHFDGHDFVDSAVQRGARGVVVASQTWERWGSLDADCFAVDDTLEALQELARRSLHRHPSEVVAITGSNGKTTTKDMTLAALQVRGAVWGTQGNLNNHIGVPLTVLRRRGDEPCGVVEMGANDFGEIELLSRLVSPRVAVITNIARAHLERFGSLDGVLRAKSEIFRGVGGDGIAVLNADDAHHPALRRAAAHCARIVSFGFDRAADYRIEAVEKDGPEGQTVVVQGTRLRTSRAGAANARNLAAAFAVACELDCPRDAVAEALAHCRFTQQRSAWQRVGDVWVLDDSYNANPDSMLQALALLGAHDGRRIAVLGDMLELGDASESLHAELGSEVAAAGVTHFFATGSGMQHAVRAARAAGMGDAARHFDDFDALVEALRAAVRPGDAVLVKGSRGSRMERVVEALHTEVT